MENSYTDEMYEILDEMNARIEEMINGINNSKGSELLIGKLQEKMEEFVGSLEQEIEKMGILEVSY